MSHRKFFSHDKTGEFSAELWKNFSDKSITDEVYN